MSTSSRAAYSLVELLVVATIFSLVAGTLSFLTISNDRAYKTGFTSANLEAQATLAMSRIVAELELAARDTVTPEPDPATGAELLEYVHVVDFAGGAPVVTPTRRIAFEYETGELDDGLDNNGNGLVDEGCVVLTEDLGEGTERRRVLTRWVSELMAGETANGADDNGNGLADERGFCLVRSDGIDSQALVVRLSLMRLDAQGRSMRRTAQTSVHLRNRVD